MDIVLLNTATVLTADKELEEARNQGQAVVHLTVWQIFPAPP